MYVVGTERLGWPAHRWWKAPARLFLVEFQGRLRYEDAPQEPSATCHLQPSGEVPALCGFPREGLTAVPGEPAWTDLHPEMRCSDCATVAGIATENPHGRRYRHRWSGTDPA